jgi:hypothetical protein
LKSPTEPQSPSSSFDIFRICSFQGRIPPGDLYHDSSPKKEKDRNLAVPLV